MSPVLAAEATPKGSPLWAFVFLIRIKFPQSFLWELPAHSCRLISINVFSWPFAILRAHKNKGGHRHDNND